MEPWPTRQLRLLRLKTVATAFSGGTQAAAITLPLLLGILSAAAIYVMRDGDTGTKMQTALMVLATVAVVGVGLGFWLIVLLRRAARTQALARRAELAQTIERTRLCLAASTAYIKKRHDAHLAKLDATFAEESRQRKAKTESDLTAARQKHDKLHADLDAKFTEALDKVQKKLAGTHEAAEKKYPPRLEAAPGTAANGCSRSPRNATTGWPPPTAVAPHAGRK